MKNPLKAIKVIRLGIAVIKDPTNLDRVIEMVNTVRDQPDLEEVIGSLKEDPELAAAFQRRPRLHVDVGRLAVLPEGTLGREYVHFMCRNGISSSSVPEIVVESDGTYFRQHMYETHDLWHVITGFEPTVSGEMAIQAFYLAQMPSRVAVLVLALAFINTLVLRFPEYGERMEAMVSGWQMGRAARPLFGRDWTSDWERPLAELQAELKVEPRAA